MKYTVFVEFIPDMGYSEIEWGWEAVLSSWRGGKSYKTESKFSFATIEEARENAKAIIPIFAKSLSQDRTMEWTEEVDG